MLLRVLLLSCFAINLFAASDSDKVDRFVKLPENYVGDVSHWKKYYDQNGIFDTKSGTAVSAFIHYNGYSSKKGAFLEVAYQALQKEEVVVPFIDGLQKSDNKEASVDIYLKSALKEMIVGATKVVEPKEVSRSLKLFGLLHVDMPNKESCGLSAFFQIGRKKELSYGYNILGTPENKFDGSAKHGDVKWAKLGVKWLHSDSSVALLPLELLAEEKITPKIAAAIMLGSEDLDRHSMVAVFNQKVLKAFAKKHQVSTKVDDNQSQTRPSLSPENEQK